MNLDELPKRQQSKPPISRKPEAVRARILAAAEQEFKLHGYDNANTNRIAIGFGGSKNTIFRHFESKRALFLAVLELIVSRWRGQLDLDSLPINNPRAWLQAYTEAILHWIISDDMIFVADQADLVRRHMPEITQIFRQQGHDAFSNILEVQIESWTRASILNCPDAEDAALDFLNLALMKWINRRKLQGYVMPSNAEIAASARRSIEIFFDGCVVLEGVT